MSARSALAAHDGYAATARKMRRALIVVLAVASAACADLQPATELAGKPLGEFVDDLKAELREVHWRIRSNSVACGTTEAREIDLRNATVTLDLQRIGDASVDGQLRLVAIPLGGIAAAPFASGSASRKLTQDMTLKLDVTGPARLHDPGEPPASGPVARRINEAIDGFMRSSPQEPCIRLSTLKLTLVIDVERGAGGGFKLVVPAAQLGIDLARRDVNTLTLAWDRIVSNALR